MQNSGFRVAGFVDRDDERPGMARAFIQRRQQRRPLGGEQAFPAAKQFLAGPGTWAKAPPGSRTSSACSACCSPQPLTDALGTVPTSAPAPAAVMLPASGLGACRLFGWSSLNPLRAAPLAVWNGAPSDQPDPSA